jgi:hypothetical protein
MFLSCFIFCCFYFFVPFNMSSLASCLPIFLMHICHPPFFVLHQFFYKITFSSYAHIPSLKFFALCKFQNFLLFSPTRRQHNIKHCIDICLNLQKSVKKSYKSLECSVLRKTHKSHANSDAVAVVTRTAAVLFIRNAV